MEAHEVGGSGFGAGAGDDADDLALVGRSPGFSSISSAMSTSLSVSRKRSQRMGIGAPEKHAAVDDLLEGGEGEDGWVGVVLGEEAGGGAGLGEDGDGGDVEVVGGVGHTLADGFGDGEADAGVMA